MGWYEGVLCGNRVVLYLDCGIIAKDKISENCV